MSERSMDEQLRELLDAVGSCETTWDGRLYRLVPIPLLLQLFDLCKRTINEREYAKIDATAARYMTRDEAKRYYREKFDADEGEAETMAKFSHGPFTYQ